MYRLMVESLPQAAIISIAHRSTVAAYHQRRLRYVPQDGEAARAAQAGEPGVSYRVVCEA
ncbi:hypothetical protein D3C80_2106310 [compost metagenome]